MPSPVAHSIVGLCIALLGSPRAGKSATRPSGARWSWLGASIALANLPDVDYVPGLLQGAMNRYHQFGTHSLVFVVVSSSLIALIAAACRRELAGQRLLLLALLLTGSHLVLDWHTADCSVPYGMPLFWPFSTEHIPPSQHAIFLTFRKDDLAALFSALNVRPVVRELVVTLPLLVFACVLDRRRRARIVRDQAFAAQ